MGLIQDIYVTAGGKELTKRITVSAPDGSDISALTMRMALVFAYWKDGPPADQVWRVPEVSTPAAPNRLVQMLVTKVGDVVSGFPCAPGIYRPYVKVTDAPTEIPIFVVPGVFVHVI